MRLWIAVVVLAVCCGCATAKTDETNQDFRKTIYDATLEEVAESIGLSVRDAATSVRLYYRGDCDPSPKPLVMVPFPKVELKLPPKGASDVTRIRSIFRGNDSVRVTEGRSGIIRIRIGDPAEDILRTRIRLLTFTPDEQYNGRLAITVIDTAPEVLEATAEMGLNQTLPPVFGILVAPHDSLPSLPPVIQNVNMDEALDLVAMTFRSNVTFGVCSNQYMLEYLGTLKSYAPPSR
jgi:hypothetical protein